MISEGLFLDNRKNHRSGVKVAEAHEDEIGGLVFGDGNIFTESLDPLGGQGG